MPKTKTEKLQKNLESYRKAKERHTRIIDEEKERPKDITKEEFTRYVRHCGSSGHIGVSKSWVGKLVKVNMEEVKDD